MPKTTKTKKRPSGRPAYFGPPGALPPARLRTFHMKDVRCFKGAQEFHIRPLTFVVGENSAGKTTVLACLHALCSMISMGTPAPSRPEVADFNADPYSMGTFSEIISQVAPSRKGFELGLSFRYKYGEFKAFVKFVERGDGSEPIASEVRWVLGDGTEIEFSEMDSDEHAKAGLMAVTQTGGGNFKVRVPQMFTQIGMIHLLITGLLLRIDKSSSREERALSDIFQKHLIEGMSGILNVRVNSIGPLRFKPLRTYNPVAEIRDPQGAEIPVMLMNLNDSHPDDWKWLRKRLLQFGKTSGMFQDIEVKRFGKSRGNPFQINVKVNGLKSNMVDVGYGVSQVLPTLVNIMMHENTLFLFQNPEIHLHHRAHAELTSVMAEMCRHDGNANSFVIETQSDFMIDRARIDIMRGRIKPEDVGVIYLENDGKGGSTVHNIGFDKSGNMLKRPPGYRKFFQREGDRLLGLTEA